MAEQTDQKERLVSLLITIRIDAIPASQVQAIEEEAFRVGDEFGAQVDINKGAARNVV